MDIDPATGRVFVASQSSDNVIVLDGESGEVLFDVPVGAGTLNVAFNAASGQLFVVNLTSDTVAVLDAATAEVVANLEAALARTIWSQAPTVRCFW